MAFTMDSGKNGKQQTTDPKKSDIQEDTVRRKTIATLNAIKIMAPIITALAFPNTQEKNLSGDYFLLTKATNDISKKICLEIGIDPDKSSNLWALNMVEKVVSECLKEQYISSEGIINEDLIYKSISLVVHNTELNSIAKNEFHHVNEKTAIQAAIIKAASLIFESFETGFDFNRDIVKEVDIILTHIVDKISRIESKIYPLDATDHDKAYIKSSLIVEAGQLYKTIHLAESERVKSILISKTKEEKNSIYEKYPDGFPMSNIEKKFDSFFDKLVAVSIKLS